MEDDSWGEESQDEVDDTPCDEEIKVVYFKDVVLLLANPHSSERDLLVMEIRLTRTKGGSR